MQDVLFANFPTLIASAGAIVPTLALGCGLAFERLRRSRLEKPDQPEKLLRPPGHSLSEKLEDISYSLLDTWVFATGCCVIAVLALNLEGSSWGRGTSIWSSVLNGIVALSAAGGALYLFFRVARLVRMAKYCRLGLHGKQIVAQALVEVIDSGYRAFHDLTAEGNLNLDHVVVGPQGVFMIETKTRNCRGGRPGHPAREVHVNKNTLYFPTFTDSRTMLQAERNAQWLSNYLGQKTGEPVQVSALVVLPGWQVVFKTPPSAHVDVMNPKYMVDHLRNQPDTLPDPQLVRIIEALDEKCRDIEF